MVDRKQTVSMSKVPGTRYKPQGHSSITHQDTPRGVLCQLQAGFQGQSRWQWSLTVTEGKLSLLGSASRNTEQDRTRQLSVSFLLEVVPRPPLRTLCCFILFSFFFFPFLFFSLLPISNQDSWNLKYLPKTRVLKGLSPVCGYCSEVVEPLEDGTPWKKARSQRVLWRGYWNPTPSYLSLGARPSSSHAPSTRYCAATAPKQKDQVTMVWNLCNCELK